MERLHREPATHLSIPAAGQGAQGEGLLVHGWDSMKMNKLTLLIEIEYPSECKLLHHNDKV